MVDENLLDSYEAKFTFLRYCCNYRNTDELGIISTISDVCELKSLNSLNNTGCPKKLVLFGLLF